MIRGIQPAISRSGISESRALAEDVVQDALIRILESLDSFRGASRFTTWAHKICVRVYLTEMRRRRCQDVSLDENLESGGNPLLQVSGAQTGSRDLIEHQSDMDRVMESVMQIMQDELSERQRLAMQLLTINGMPIEETARRMGTNRNALYKLVHDARKKMKTALADRGFAVKDLLFQH